MSIRPPPEHAQSCLCAECEAWEEEVRADFVRFCDEALERLPPPAPMPVIADAGSEMTPTEWREAVDRRLAEYRRNA